VSADERMDAGMSRLETREDKGVVSERGRRCVDDDKVGGEFADEYFKVFDCFAGCHCVGQTDVAIFLEDNRREISKAGLRPEFARDGFSAAPPTSFMNRSPDAIGGLRMKIFTCRSCGR